MAKLKKETRIKNEFERLKNLYIELPDNRFKLYEHLIQNAAFIKVTLEDLQSEINNGALISAYQNGNNQSGTKASAELQAYNSLIKNYDNIIKHIEASLPAEKKSSKLASLMDE